MLGGIVAGVLTLPWVLDSTFDAIKSSSSDMVSGGIEFSDHKFRRYSVTKREPYLDAEAIFQKLGKGILRPKDICTDDYPNVVCEEVTMSDSYLQTRELLSLAKLKKAGQLSLVLENNGNGAIYEFVSLQKKNKVGAADDSQQGYPGSRQPLILIALGLLGAVIGAGLGNLIIKFFQFVALKWEEMETGDRVNLFLSALTGIIASMPFLITFSGLGSVVGPLATFGLTIGFSVLAFYALNTFADVLPWKKGEIRGRKSGIKVLDTNVLIDGRIYDLLRTGFLEGELYVPKFVLLELQHIADSADSLRRQRGRRGLEVLKHIQSETQVEIGTHDRLAGDVSDEVDTRLVKLAMALGADLVSNDYNLNRVASIQSVRVLNINDLALSLRPNILPGETLELTIIREGSQQRQGVGYLEDGTMVVVDNARDHVGETHIVTVTQVIQTERGKMIFGSMDSLDDNQPSAKR